MKIKTSELTGPALNWAVAKAAGLTQGQIAVDAVTKGFYAPSTNWAQAGPIIESERIETRHDGRKSWCAWHRDYGAIHGPTILIAAMRCYVASVLGDEVEIPEELK